MAAATLSKCRTILQIIYEHTLYSVWKPPWAVLFISETSHESKSGYYWLICQVIITYGRLQNDRHEINEYF